MTADVIGPVGAIGMNWWKAASSDDPNLRRRFERVMPPALASMSRSMRALYDGSFTDSRGDKLVPLEPGDPEHLAEVLAMSIGIRPRVLSEAQEANWSRYEAEMYVRALREHMLQEWVYARDSGDKEGVASALRNIRNFNGLATPGTGISTQDMMRSLKTRTVNRRLRERGLPSSERWIPLARQTEASYPGVEALRQRTRVPEQSPR